MGGVTAGPSSSADAAASTAQTTSTGVDAAAAIGIALCLGLMIAPVLAGIGGAATAALLKERV